ncbi:MAG: tRNA uridine-5-carboxymethylaminomethyl(34) synthesis GTPase MnmE, partial [Desulfobacterales bacterium]
MTPNSDTIAAIASSGGSGGIGIVKISGSKAFAVAKAVFRPADRGQDSKSVRPSALAEKNRAFEFESHRLYYGHILDPQNGAMLDEVLLSAMKAPRTYTREDVVEINAHGGAVVLHAILQVVLKMGARLAEPGEFTRRAFFNGRIDLTQAEAVVDVINARTQKSLHLAASQVSGKLRKQITSIRGGLVDLLTRIEAAIDFPDDVTEFIQTEDTVKSLQKEVLEPLRGLIRNYVDAHVFRDGLAVAVVGRPNVGKSSLLNQLVQKDRAIVTDVPGTTRDVIEETLNLEGIPVVVSDTAGVHHTDHPVEKIGIEKTLEHVNGSDVVLFMIEANCPLGPEDHLIYDRIHSKSIIVVINKIDLVREGNETTLPSDWRFEDQVRISALYDQGIDQLKDKVIKIA